MKVKNLFKQEHEVSHEVLEIAKKMHESVFDDEVSRVVTTLEIDDRGDKELTSEGKKESVK